MEFYRSHILVCSGTGCHASGSMVLKEALEKEIARVGLDKEVKVIETGCFGFCRFGPNMMVYPEGVFYCQVHEEDVPELVEEHLIKGRVVPRLLYREPETERAVVDFEDIPFFHKQTRVVLEDCGIINPESIREYIARDGYFGLAKALQMKPEEVIDEVKKAGLRGRGGAGFPTGLKWEFAAKAEGSPKYIVCNADEGDPGAFMDRSTIEGDPHRLLEGMTIAGYAVGASQGYVYVRAEYPLAVRRLYKAIDDARELGLLGKNILNSGFDFDIDLRLGAGAFVCGEETALLNSIMGLRGEPRPRPPFPANEGLWGKPTVINNVETFANVPVILRKGHEWFNTIGTEASKGTKVFALAGQINNNGLAEVPMGTSIGEIVFDIGGGLPDGKKFKAVQTGGPSGGCIPVEYLNTPVDYESLAELGTIMGSGGFVVMDQDTCMVDLAKFFLEFVQSESCGKCAPCRIGTKRMLEILHRISQGEGKVEDIETLEELGNAIKESALCGLGQSAPNPVLSTIKYFREEYEAHIIDKKCPASVCAALFTAPCQNTCPANVDVPMYVDLIAQGRFAEAYEEILRENPLPVVCGRVCNHPCESRCRRSQLDEPIAIRDLKRFASDYAVSLNGARPKPSVKPPTGKKVAIVGAGPAGLTAAHYLALQGHSVTIYEALPVAGGMLAVGIPEYRLPKHALNKDIEAIENLGVTIKTGVKVGTDISWETLKQEYDATFIAIGAHKDQRMGIPGEDLPGVVPGVVLLRDINLGKDVDLEGKKVVVVGGGNVAMDAARSAKRLGAESVTVVYRRRKEDMPAEKEEIEAAMEEGISFNLMVNPVEIIGDGKVEKVRCVKMRAGEFDSSGRRRTYPIEGSEFDLECDVFIPAIGQVPDTDVFMGDGLEIKRGGTFEVDPRTLATDIPSIFAGGDCVTGPATVVEAIEAGKKAASSINELLVGDPNVVPEPKHERKLTRPIVEDKLERIRAKELSPNIRVNSFAEVELGYDATQAQQEAMRCLRCDVKE
ncbi:MAG TPA: NADH-quinone oxidoreductase subunit NuoF [Bacillota bacterium]|nr:NADH-quinone oxidoreductase subunit NuoF [Candidatus Fermentithermobacillaceae bacterium]HOK64534.1 NADH-quinone oxidoreductase subunit NuoF [Bacillota bacterium]HOL12047.1 NADH-quinone oxidoreductase subunit NuoF [Bacillota bacterium]HOQ03117.1 NADH-quinone oxidoreductase subunit NuoF [Bacillota bacterium]HPP60872.1 NADH-quinone oxidoreductase subunit NuoF [Bacillota bacterium]